MRSLGVPNREVFESWLAAERECLKKLSTELLEETLQMEYYQKLVNLHDHECAVLCSCSLINSLIGCQRTLGGGDGPRYRHAARQAL